jgi:cytochrome c oxidase assembly protein subunit 15
MRVPAIGPAAATRTFRLALAALCLIVVTGAGVRLTQSGLGCPDWPTCSAHRLVAAWHYHAVIEFGNRLVTVAVTVAVVAALAAAWRRRPYRRDLVLLAAGTVAGVVAQAVLGGITVLEKLAPGWVMAHFLLSMAVVAVGVVLVHRAGEGDGPVGRRPLVGTEVRAVSAVLVALAAVVLGLGTVVSGAGPHSGSKGVGRLPISPRDAAEIHSTLVMLLVGVILATVLLIRPGRAPERVARRAQLLLYVAGAQAVVGYTQYFTGVPAALVELHVVGALAVWVCVLRLHLALSAPVGPVPATGDPVQQAEAVLADAAVRP